jgi:hypothetical protein
MTTQKEITGKTTKELVELGILFECDMYSNRRNEFEDTVFLTDGYKKILGILTSKDLIGTEKQVKWAIDIRNESASKIAFQAVSLLVSNCFKGDYDINKFVGNEKKTNFSNLNASFWIENRYYN